MELLVTMHDVARLPARGSVEGERTGDMAGAHGVQEDDPAQAAEIIVSLVHSDDVPLRLRSDARR